MGLLVVNSDYERLYGVPETPPEPTREELTQMYLTFEALEDGSIGVNIPSGVGTSLVTSVSYSIDEGETWTTTNNVDSTEINIVVDNVKKGDKILWKGSATSYSMANSSSQFMSSEHVNIYGNIMSLLYGDDFIDYDELPSKYTFMKLFKELNVVNAKGLILSTTTLSQNCYNNMFCDCTSLTTAPELPATTLADYCYTGMFSDCTSLTTAPELPATTLAPWCYEYMFLNCTSLTTAPELPATTLTKWCYFYMFNGCSKLNNVTMLAISITGNNPLGNWMQNVSPTGTFVKAAGVELPSGTSGIPSGWTVEEV